MKRLTHAPRGEGGFTLVEITVVMLILSLLLGIFYAFIFFAERTASRGRDWLEANEAARLALDRLSRELREADFVNEVTGSTGIRFSADYNDDGAILASQAEELSYVYDAPSGELRVSIDGINFEVLARSLAAFSFTYFGTDPALDADGDGVVEEAELDTDGTPGLNSAERNRISSAEIRATVQIENQGHSYRTGVELRNVFG
ncbi:MAG: PilW family protein [Actinomycetota bacterium]